MKKKIKESDADWKEWKNAIKKQSVNESNSDKPINRNDLNIQHFMDDMQLIGNQVKNTKLRKPNFFYSDLSVTNYLLWLIMAELMILNKLGEE